VRARRGHSMIASGDDLVGAGKGCRRESGFSTVRQDFAADSLYLQRSEIATQPCVGDRARVLRCRRRHPVDEIEPALDPVEPAIDIVEPLLNAGVIQFDAGHLGLERAEPRHNLVELALDAAETGVEPREADPQDIENVTGFAHA
jgi:hypothetical protein